MLFNRHRETADPLVQVTATLDSSWYDPVPEVWTSSYGRKAIDDVETKGFGRAIREGQIINNDLSIDEYHVNEVPGIFSYFNNATPSTWLSWTNFYTVSNFIGPNDPRLERGIKDPVIEDLKSRAKQSAIANLDKTPYAFGEDMFEIRKSLETLRDPLDGLRRTHDKLASGLKTYHRSKGSAAEKSLQSLSNLWLSARYQYGSIAYTAVNLFNYAHGQRLLASTNRAGARRKARSGSFSDSVNFSKTLTTGGARNWTYAETCMDKVECHASILYELARQNGGHSYDLGLRFKDLPRAAWQIMPLTWLSDRFFDISKMIHGTINILDPNINVLAGSVVTYRESNSSRNVISADQQGWTHTVSGSKTWRTRSIVREAWIPSVGDTAPVFFLDSLRDVKQTIDLAAVLTNRLGRVIPLK